MARYCTCGAMLDITGLRKAEAERIRAEWEARHWHYQPMTINGEIRFVPVGQKGHDYAGGPVVVRMGERMTTGGEA